MVSTGTTSVVVVVSMVEEEEEKREEDRSRAREVAGAAGRPLCRRMVRNETNIVFGSSRSADVDGEGNRVNLHVCRSSHLLDNFYFSKEKKIMPNDENDERDVL